MALEIYNVILPDGYEILDPSRLEDGIGAIMAETGLEVRFLGKIPLLFDPDHPGYQAYLAQCKNDGKGLVDAVQKTVSARNLPIRVKYNIKKGFRAAWPKLSVLVRPPFTSSCASTHEKKGSRIQAGKNELIFTFHVSIGGKVQALRSINPPIHQEFGKRITDVVKAEEERDFYSQHYGDWEPFASHFVNTLSRNIHHLNGAQSA